MVWELLLTRSRTALLVRVARGSPVPHCTLPLTRHSTISGTPPSPLALSLHSSLIHSRTQPTPSSDPSLVLHHTKLVSAE